MPVSQSQCNTFTAAAAVDRLGNRESPSSQGTGTGRMQGLGTSHEVAVADGHCNVQLGTEGRAPFRIDVKSDGDSGASPNISQNPEPTGMFAKLLQLVASIFRFGGSHGPSAGAHSGLQGCSTACSSVAHLQQPPSTVQVVQTTSSDDSRAALMARLAKTSAGASSKTIEKAQQAREAVRALDLAVREGDASLKEIVQLANLTCRSIKAQMSGSKLRGKLALFQFDKALARHLTSVRGDENASVSIDWSELRPGGDVRKALKMAFQMDAGQKDALLSRTLTKIVLSAARTDEEKSQIKSIIKDIKAGVLSPEDRAEQATHRLLAELGVAGQDGIATSADSVLKLMRSVCLAVKSEVRAKSKGGVVSERAFVTTLDKHLASIRSGHNIQGTDHAAWANHHMEADSDSMMAFGKALQSKAKPDAQEQFLSRTFERVFTSFGDTDAQRQEIYDHIQGLKPLLRGGNAG